MSWHLGAAVSFTETADGAVLLNERTSRYFQLNGSGSLVLRMLLTGGGVQAAISTLCQRYPDSTDRVPGDVEQLITALVRAGLVIR